MLRTFLKQLFCSHIWKQISEWEELRKSRESSGSNLPGMITYNDYIYYSAKFKCLKCDKEEIREKRVLKL